MVGGLDKKIGSRLTSTDKIILCGQWFKIIKSLVVSSHSYDDRIQRPRPQFTSPIRFDLGSDKKISATTTDNHDNKIHTLGQEWINARILWMRGRPLTSEDEKRKGLFQPLSQNNFVDIYQSVFTVIVVPPIFFPLVY